MATLVQNANDVASCATAIDAAIVAKGGTLVGGGKLRNAAAGIAAIPSGGITTSALSVTANGTYTAPSGEAYTPVTVAVDSWPKAWLNDQKTHLWYYVDKDIKPTVKFTAMFISDGHTFTADWGDGTVDTVAASTDYTNRTLQHQYTQNGTYVASIYGYDSMKFGQGNDFGDGYAYQGYLALRQAEIYATEYMMQNSMSTGNLVAIKFENGEDGGVIPNFRQSNFISVEGLDFATDLTGPCFFHCYSLKSIKDLSGLTQISYGEGFSKDISLTDVYFSLKTHTEVMALTGFTYLPNFGRTCVFHCSDGDYYRSGTSLLPVS